jgi:hypothetical protein
MYSIDWDYALYLLFSFGRLYGTATGQSQSHHLRVNPMPPKPKDNSTSAVSKTKEEEVKGNMLVSTLRNQTIHS